VLRKSRTVKSEPKTKINSDRSTTRLESIRSAHNADERHGVDDDNNNRTDRMEDYLEVIYELIQQKGYATTMLQKLDESRYLDYEKYRGIRLTQVGSVIAKNIRQRHSLLVEFLKMIGVNEGTANKDAEGIEHHLHPETLEKLEEFVKAIKRTGKNQKEDIR
jgi:Mn-dependent DtxR family transcriptional regulator